MKIKMKEGFIIMSLKDVTIVGGGPAGLSAVLYSVRAGLNTVLIEADEYSGSQVLYTNDIDNYLGFPDINGYELMEKFRSHLKNKAFDKISGSVISISKSNDIFTIELNNSEKIQSETVIFATGAEHKTLDIDGEKKLGGRGVSYCAICDGAFFKNKISVIIGGGDTAFKDALYLSKICSQVFIVHRRNSFKASKGLINMVLSTKNIKIITDTVPLKITGENKVEGIILKNLSNETITELKTDAVFVAVGMRPRTKILEKLDILDKQGYIIANEDGITALKGFFAAGDVRTKNTRQIITAVSDGAYCAVSAEKYLSTIKK